MSKKFFLCVFLSFLLIVFFACTKSGNGNGNGNGTAKANPSFANDIQPIFNSNCAIAGCHDSATAQAGLILAQGQAYGNLVNVDSTREPDKKRVLPSDADNSYLVIKLEGRQTVGGRMPVGGSISAVDLQNIKNWINNGAPNN